MNIYTFEDFNFDSAIWELIIRLLCAFIAGFVIGFERERNGHPAGLKTHILVSVGACLIMIISTEAFSGGDPARLAAQVVSGIGFIGAGAIMRDNAGGIKGITTAATLWIVACIGLGFGSGMFYYTLVALSIVTVTLIFIKKIENKITRKNCIITLTCDSNQMISQVIINAFSEYEIEIKDFVINPLTTEVNKNISKVIIKVSLQPNINTKLSNAIAEISEQLKVQNLHIKNINL